jgi:PhnB protein
MPVKPIPDGYHSLTPRIFVDDPTRCVEFLKAALDAIEKPHDERSPAEMVIGDSILIVSGTEVRPRTTAFLYLYVPDADSAYRRAIAAGATSLEEPQLVPYGDRRAMVQDPFGNIWQIATRIR